MTTRHVPSSRRWGPVGRFGDRRAAKAAAVVLALMLAAAVTLSPAGAADGFSDVSDTDGHAPAINALAAQGVFADTECGESLFCPGDSIERWIMGVWLIRVLGDQPTAVGTTRFSDVETDVWWAPYLEQLADRGITTGCETEPLRYCPDKPVTRAQMATFLHRALNQAVTVDFEVSDDVLDAELTDISTGATVNLRSLVNGEKPLLFWFWAPW